MIAIILLTIFLALACGLPLAAASLVSSVRKDLQKGIKNPLDCSRPWLWTGAMVGEQMKLGFIQERLKELGITDSATLAWLEYLATRCTTGLTPYLHQVDRLEEVLRNGGRWQTTVAALRYRLQDLQAQALVFLLKRERYRLEVLHRIELKTRRETLRDRVMGVLYGVLVAV